MMGGLQSVTGVAACITLKVVGWLKHIETTGGWAVQGYFVLKHTVLFFNNNHLIKKYSA